MGLLYFYYSVLCKTTERFLFTFDITEVYTNS